MVATLLAMLALDRLSSVWLLLKMVVGVHYDSIYSGTFYVGQHQSEFPKLLQRVDIFHSTHLHLLQGFCCLITSKNHRRRDKPMKKMLLIFAGILSVMPNSLRWFSKN